MNEQPSGTYKTVSQLGTAIGAAAAIFVTPLFYGWSKAAVWRTLVANFGHDYAPWLLWTTGAIEAFIVFTVCKAVITFALSWLMTALVARGLTNY